MSLISRFLAALRGEWSPGSARASITSLRLSAELANTLLIDVREPDEWRSEHIAGAIHIPLGQLAQRVDSIDPELTVAVICRSRYAQPHRDANSEIPFDRSGQCQRRNASLDRVRAACGHGHGARISMTVASGAWPADPIDKEYE